MPKNLVGCLITLFSIFLMATTVYGQTEVRIVGTVTDSSGAVIRGAKVSAIEVGTGFKRTVISNDAGYYVISGIRHGDYRVECEFTGFKRFVRAGITLDVDQTAEINIELAPGQVTTLVEVSGNASKVDTQTATLKHVVDERHVRELPLNGRDPTQLVLLVPGVVGTTRDTSGLRQGGSGRGIEQPGIASNGGRSNMVDYNLDGAPHNDTYTNVAMVMPDPDALEEFSVQTNNYDAEFGRSSGAIVNAVTKSGTNAFHGSIFEFHRNEAFNAYNFFAQSSDGLKRNQFGGTLGGPVVIPGLYSGHDKTFFFFSYQKTLNRSRPTDRSTVVLTEAQRNGDFSAYNQPIIDPLTGGPFLDNQIPIDRLNYVTKNIFDSLLPLPTEPDTGLYWYSTRNNSDMRQIVAKVDHQFTPNSILTVRYLDNYYENPGNPTKLLFENQGISITPSRNFMIVHKQILSPTLLNTAEFSFNRRTSDYLPNWTTGFDDLGVNNIYVDQPTSNFHLSVTGAFSVTKTERDTTQPIVNVFRDTVGWTHGNHAMSMGFEYLHQRLNKDYRWILDPFLYFQGYNTGYGPSDFFLGLPSLLIQKNHSEAADQHYAAYVGFFQDDIRLRRNLTLNLGVRYEPFIPYVDDSIRMSVFRPGMNSQLFENAPAGMVFGGEQGIPKAGTNSDLNNFAPRIGIAWRPFGDNKTSIRSGYGIFYDSSTMSAISNVFQNVAPYGTRLDLTPTPGPFEDPYAGNNPFPLPFPPPSDVSFPQGLSMATYPERFGTAYLQSWNFTVEREVFPTWVVRAAYAGSKGTRLLQGWDRNAAVYIPGESDFTNYQERKPFPAFSSIEVVDSVGNSSYNSLQLTLDKRLGKNFGIMANYTWSKSIDYGSGGGTRWPDYSNPFDHSADRGLSDFNRTHRFAGAWLYNLPRLNSPSPVVGILLNGWAVNGTFIFQSGPSFSVFSGIDNSLSDAGTNRADLVGDPTRSAGVDPIREWFNTEAFAQNAGGTFGNSGRNIISGPGYATVDTAVTKAFTVWRESQIQFRFEAFNALNHPNFALPSSTLTSGTYGRITSAYDPRILQFGLKWRF